MRLTNNNLIRHFFNISSKFVFFIFKQSSAEVYLEKYNLIFFLNFIKFNTLLQFNTLIDIAVVDFQHSLNRFKLIYNFLSVFQKKRLSVNCFVSELDFFSSIKNIYFSAD